MKYSLLLTVSLVFLLVSAARAQQVPAKAAPAGSAASASSTPSTPPKLTPRQVAEMRADLLMAQKEFSEAITAYKRVLKTDPNDAVLLDKIGVAYQEMLKLGDAEKYYKKSAKADKTFASALNNIGTVEYEKKHYGKSVKFYKKALKIRSDMATVYTNLGYAYFEEKKYPDAILAFRQALVLDPTIFYRQGEGGAIVQQRSTTDPGLFYYYVAKSYALGGDAEHAAHFLKLARDDGYKGFTAAEKDPAFAKVIKDPRVQAVFTVIPSYEATAQRKSTSE